MSGEPELFGFGQPAGKKRRNKATHLASGKPEEYPLDFLGHYKIGRNPNHPLGVWDTKEQAESFFASEFNKLCEEAKGHFLLVRTPAKLHEVNSFDSDRTKYVMAGRFSVAKLKDKYNDS